MGHQRSACDRCRGQKLRCPRSNQSTSEQCARCLRVGVQCVTSSARPLGRPRTAGVVERRTQRTRTETTAPEALSVDPTSLRLSSTTEDVQTYSDPWTAVYLDPDSGYLPNPSHVAGPYFENPAPSPAFGTNADCAFDLQLPVHDDLFDLGQSTELSQRPQDDFDELALAGSLRREPSLELSEPADTITALSRLNEDIARQISHLDSYIWAPVSAAQHCLEKLHKIEGNPLAEMLQSTSRFVTILENLEPLSFPPNKSVEKSMAHFPSATDSNIPNSDSEQVETMSSTTLSPVHPPAKEPRQLSTPTALMLLSSYLLLLELYDAIFGRVHDALSGLEDICAFFQELPEFRVAGLPSMKGHLYAKIIIQIIEHHFDRLERLLGLPVEFGLSEQAPNSMGLLGATDLSQLLHIAMTQMTGSPGTSGSLTLKSFRDNLKALQAMLPR